MQDAPEATPQAGRQHTLVQIRRDLAGLELGPEMQENVQQHYHHLETLMASPQNS